MPLDDAIRRASERADGAAGTKRDAADYQARQAPRAVDATRRLFQEAVGAFEASGARPTHMLRVVQTVRRIAVRGLWGGLVDRITPPEDEFRKLQHGWNVNRVFLGADGRVYSAHGRGTYQVPRLEEAGLVKPWPDAPAARGLLKLGLAPGDNFVIVEDRIGHMFQEIDLSGRMFAAPVDLVPVSGGSGHFDLPLGTGDGQDFVSSPGGVIFMRCDGYEHHWYDKLEDVLAAEIVRLRR